VPEHFDVTADRQLLERMPGVETQSEHPRAADTKNTAFGSLACSAWISWLASRSPEASPATMAIRSTAAAVIDDAALRYREEVDQRLDLGMGDGLFDEFGARLFEHQSRLVERAVGTFQGQHRLWRKTPPLQPSALMP
jgi:hypothetical protein